VFESNSEIFFLSSHFLFGGSSWIWMNTLSLADVFFWVVILDKSRLAFGWIQYPLSVTKNVLTATFNRVILRTALCGAIHDLFLYYRAYSRAILRQ